MRVESADHSDSLPSGTGLRNLESLVARYWWTLVIRGLVALVFGVAMFVLPGPTLAALVLVFGAYTIADGVAALIIGIKQFGDEDRWWVTLLGGVLSVSAGAIALLSPGAVVLAVLWLIAAWAIARGAVDVVAAVQLRRVIEGEWLLALGGLLSIVFGLLLLVYPDAGVLAVITFVGSFAVVLGIVLSVCGLRLRRVARAAAA
jgi:uncharacterized membrane protein HdeD (DUF308 family)